MANAKVPLVVDHTGSGLDPRQTAKSFGKRLVVIDPTDKKRNVAANVSDESFARLVLLCRALVADPSLKLFNGAGYSDLRSAAKLSAVAEALGVGLYAVRFEADEISDEVIWQQLKRMMLGINAELSKLGFAPLLSLQEVERKGCRAGIHDKRGRGSFTGSLVGPSALMKEAADAFASAHKSVVFRSLESDRLYVVEKSECSTPEEALRWILKSKVQAPSHFRKRMKVCVNDVPEDIAKLLYRAYIRKTVL